MWRASKTRPALVGDSAGRSGSAGSCRRILRSAKIGSRYQTPEALAEDLRRFLDDRSIVARRASLPEQAWPWCRRNPATAALVASLLALLLLATGGGVWLVRQQAERQAEAARRRRSTTCGWPPSTTRPSAQRCRACMVSRRTS